MKIERLLYLALIAALGFVLVAKTDFLLRAGKTIGWIPPEEWNPDQLRGAMDVAARTRAAPDGALVLLGDSIVAQVDAALVGADAVNAGLGGDTTRTLLARIPTLRVLDHARAIVLEVGTNDLKYRLPVEIAVDYARLLLALPAAGPVVVIGVLPVDERQVHGRPSLRNDRIGELDRLLETVCAQRAGCRYANPFPAFAGQGDLYSDDGWHLSAKGNRVLAGLMNVAR